jgi:hypothetical protein
MHDINKSAFNVFIPLLNIYYVFVVGTKGNNEYGIDPSPQKNIKYFDQISSFEASNDSSASRIEIIKIFAILFLLFFSFYGMKINSGYASGKNIITRGLPNIDVIANVKNNARLKIGFISVSVLDDNKNECLRKIFDKATIKYVQKDNIENIIQALRDNRIDLLLLSPSESIRISEKLDRTNRFFIRSISKSAMFLVPPENSDLVESLNECLTDVNVSK